MGWSPFGRLLQWLSPQEAAALPSGPQFSVVGPESIDPSFFGLTSYADTSSKVSRRAAAQVPAVKRGRDLIAGTLGTIPMTLRDAHGDPASWTSELLRQPERDVVRSVTIAKTVEDLIFEGVAWWLVTEYDWRSYPSKVVRLDAGVDVAQQAQSYRTKMGHSGVATRYEQDFDLIRFDSPCDPLLVAGARAIRTHLALDRAVNKYASGNQPLDFFTSSDGVDPEQEELDAFFDAWEAARRQHATGYVPAALKYETAGWNPEQLELAAQRDHAAKEIATLMGIAAERVNVSTTSRTYANMAQDQQAFITGTLNPYAVAISERLSMGDVTPRGYVVKWDWAEFLRTDDATRVQIAVQGKSGGIFTTEEARSYFDQSLPPMPEQPEPTPAPVPVAPEEEAVSASNG